METAEEVKQEAKSRIRHTEGELRKGMSAGEELVRDHPVPSALIAAGIGFVIAQLPARTLAGWVIKGAVFFLKPAAVLYAISKILEDAGSRERAQELSADQRR